LVVHSSFSEIVPLPSHADERRAAMEVVARLGAPAFLRPAKRVETAFTDLIDRMRIRRDELLKGVRLHLRLLLDVASSLNVVRAHFTDEQFTALSTLVADFGVTERPTTGASSRRVRRGLRDLAASVARFNRRWLACVADADLSEVNAERDGYNRWYLLEKDCAVGVIRARQGFQPLPPVSPADVLRELPPLPEFALPAPEKSL